MIKSGFTLKKFIILGILFVAAVGSLLHFLYDWSNQNILISFIAPVSESVWEHFKLGFYALLLYGLITYFFIRDKVNNFIFGLSLSSIGLNVSIGLLFYLYKLFIHHSIPWIDITLFIIGIIFAFFILYKILTLPPLPPIFNWIGIFIILITISGFVIFTLKPLTRFDIFKDPTK
ncbi:DUF6512 family protein [Niameybacter massiliensis]|uniref:DUF6512 family protein n=1 Tax=Holtiella tumoricola TaxID=3018743 RepID=A0AA42DLV3_9FIRM|nr:DUF6512 family protein [Holtiella tumoricola]MDA3731187.1 DUF6512 family protein [Holtiella tumoricola]